MRLLLDENLSESIAMRIRADFPDTEHVRRALGPGRADSIVWAHARSEARTIVTLDEDFERLSLKHGAPPKVILIDSHNASSLAIARLILARRDSISDFGRDAESAILVLRAEGARR